MQQQTYTQVAQEILAALKRIESSSQPAEQETSIQLLSARLEHIEHNQQETIDALHEMNGHQRTNTQALVQLMQWKDDHAKETHPGMTKQIDDLGSKVTKIGVRDGAVTLVGVIIAGVVAWFQGNK